MRAALLQLNSGDDPAENLPVTVEMVRKAAAGGAQFVLTPEVTNCVSASRTRQRDVLQSENDDRTLRALREQAAESGIWLLIGSLALGAADQDGRFFNRSFLIGPGGEIAARYDKIHMFDVAVSETETYRESRGYRPGNRVVLAGTDFGKLGLTICYDLRFPRVYRSLAQAGAQIIAIPSAFSPVTGAAHWETLLRARAIETGCFILAPAQTGSHTSAEGMPRQTYGHSLAVGPWGDILADGGTETGVIFIDLDIEEVANARQRIPSLAQDTQFDGP